MNLNGNERYVPLRDVPSWNDAAGSGTVTSVAGSSGVVTSPNPITGAGTVSLAPVANNTVLGNNSGGSAAPAAKTGTEVTALLDTFSTASTTKGVVPGSNGAGATAFLNGNGGWTVPPGTATGTVTSVGSGAGLTGGTITTAGTLSVTNAATDGFTAQTTYATGDILYASASNTLSKRAIGSTGEFLTVSAGIPAWGAAVGSSAGRTVAARNQNVAKTITAARVFDRENGNGNPRLDSLDMLRSITWTLPTTLYADAGTISSTTGNSTTTSTFLASAAPTGGSIDLNIGYTNPFTSTSFTSLATATVLYTAASLNTVSSVAITWSSATVSVPAGNVLILKTTNNLTAGVNINASTMAVVSST